MVYKGRSSVSLGEFYLQSGTDRRRVTGGKNEKKVSSSVTRVFQDVSVFSTMV